MSDDAKNDDVLPQYLDSSFWHPTAKNFEVIDWEKWDAKNPKPPREYSPPQFTDGCMGCLFSINWWSHRSPVCTPCFIPLCCNRFCSPRPETLTISDEEETLFKALLDPQRASESAPDIVRGVWWMRDNIGEETLLAPQTWAWKSTPPGEGPVGLFTIKHNWTSDPTCAGCVFATASDMFVTYGNVQIHPEKTWIALAFFSNPDERVFWHWIYVVQEGDEFVTPDGRPLDYLKPGDWIRLTWGENDAYECDNTKLTYMYTPLRVATLDEDGAVVKVQPGYDELVKRATESAEKRPMCCSRCACNMSQAERVDFQLAELSDRQQWKPGPPPPSAEAIDRL